MKTHLIPASLNSASAKARMLFAAMLLGSASLLVACGEPTNPAADYLATADSGTGTTTPDPVDPPATDEGNATTGAALIKANCLGCHGTTTTGGVAMKQKLNSSAVDLLEGAPTKQPIYHGNIPQFFTGQNLLDLKAACAAVP